MQDNPVANTQDMSVFFHLLSPSLRLSAHHFINQKIFQLENSLLNGIHAEDMNTLVGNMSVTLFVQGEKVINSHEPGQHVYFIVDGVAEVYLERQVPLRAMRAIEGY